MIVLLINIARGILRDELSLYGTRSFGGFHIIITYLCSATRHHCCGTNKLPLRRMLPQIVAPHSLCEGSKTEGSQNLSSY